MTPYDDIGLNRCFEILKVPLIKKSEGCLASPVSHDAAGESWSHELEIIVR